MKHLAPLLPEFLGGSADRAVQPDSCGLVRKAINEDTAGNYIHYGCVNSA
ncbi:hypothetical protein [Raoultella ornithinolytica]